ncbi:MAG TPA: methyltransferase domain-containing protein [Gammaproteobacteria bacterium]|nr:methyltransferase domain-containing protein [Gammaproteobacteria bacterium]
MSESAATLYGEDLAYIQAEGFGGMAEAAAPEIVALLRERGIATGTIGDIGCGAGVSTRCFLEAGYGVWALEPSRALLELARAAARGAEFLPPASLYDTELLPADALVALGEPLTYHDPGSDADTRVLDFFSRAAAVLGAGGLLVFDVIVRGEPSLDARSWRAGEDWAVLVETRGDASSGWLRREIQTFRRIGEGGADYRRGRETHHVRLFDADALAAALRERGFEVETARAYGRYDLATRRLAYICSRRG